VPAFALSRGGFRLKVMMYDSSGPLWIGMIISCQRLHYLEVVSG